jgi:hypothetical protein
MMSFCLGFIKKSLRGVMTLSDISADTAFPIAMSSGGVGVEITISLFFLVVVFFAVVFFAVVFFAVVFFAVVFCAGGNF